LSTLTVTGPEISHIGTIPLSAMHMRALASTLHLLTCKQVLSETWGVLQHASSYGVTL